MRIFNHQGLGARDKPKKKIKYEEIYFTSHYSFLRVRRDQFLQNCKKPTLISTKKITLKTSYYTLTLDLQVPGSC
jgi:hypothetical protein